MRRLRAALVVLTLLAGLALLAFVAVGRGPGEAAVAVRREDLVLSVDLTGVLKAVHSELLGPPQIDDTWDFKIAMMAPEGSNVKQGQPVLGFDTSELDRMLQEKMAESEQARKEMEKKETDLRLKEEDDALRLAEARARLKKARLKLEVPPELARARELEQARLDAGLAEREITFLESRSAAGRRAAASELADLGDRRDRAAARVQELQRSIQAMRVVAPRDGVIIYRESRRGEKKKIGDTCWRAERVLEIPDVSEMAAEGEIDEADAGKVKAGQAVSFRLDAHPDLEYRGRIESVASVVDRPAPESPLKVVRVAIALERTDRERMRPGMRFRGSAEVGRARDALAVPAQAVHASPEGPVAYRLGLFGAVPVPVKIGRRNARLVEITGGLAEGERVAAVAPGVAGS